MTDQDTRYPEGQLLELQGQPTTLLDPRTGRAVRVLCWTVTVILWAWLVLGAAAVFAFAAGVASNPRP